MDSSSSSRSSRSRRSCRGRSQRLEDRQDVLLDRQLAEHRRLLRQVADALPRPLVHRRLGDVLAVERDLARLRAGSARRSGRTSWSCPRRWGRAGRRSRPAATCTLTSSTTRRRLKLLQSPMPSSTLPPGTGPVARLARLARRREPATRRRRAAGPEGAAIVRRLPPTTAPTACTRSTLRPRSGAIQPSSARRGRTERVRFSCTSSLESSGPLRPPRPARATTVSAVGDARASARSTPPSSPASRTSAASASGTEGSPVGEPGEQVAHRPLRWARPAQGCRRRGDRRRLEMHPVHLAVDVHPVHPAPARGLHAAP